MRANRKVRLAGNEKGQVGIGTMIVFIATVLVAAIAASVLIDTSGKLQERSSRTGNQATEQVASNLRVERLIGARDDNSAATKIENLTIWVSLAPGASKVDLKQLKVRITDGTTTKDVGWASDNVADADGFSADEARDSDDSMASGTGSKVMTAGDLAKLVLNLDNAAGLNLPLDVRASVQMKLYPEVGSPVKADFKTPESFGKDTQIELR
ncbi:MAG: archaellin/type IV pilin N-terminal domain-containing protein [Methanobacteriota archaeon]